jgi:hypothetical protein
MGCECGSVPNGQTLGLIEGAYPIRRSEVLKVGYDLDRLLSTGQASNGIFDVYDLWFPVDECPKGQPQYIQQPATPFDTLVSFFQSQPYGNLELFLKRALFYRYCKCKDCDPYKDNPKPDEYTPPEDSAGDAFNLDLAIPTTCCGQAYTAFLPYQITYYAPEIRQVVTSNYRLVLNFTGSFRINIGKRRIVNNPFGNVNNIYYLMAIGENASASRQVLQTNGNYFTVTSFSINANILNQFLRDQTIQQYGFDPLISNSCTSTRQNRHLIETLSYLDYAVSGTTQINPYASITKMTFGTLTVTTVGGQPIDLDCGAGSTGISGGEPDNDGDPAPITDIGGQGGADQPSGSPLKPFPSDGEAFKSDPNNPCPGGDFYGQDLLDCLDENSPGWRDSWGQNYPDTLDFLGDRINPQWRNYLDTNLPNIETDGGSILLVYIPCTPCSDGAQGAQGIQGIQGIQGERGNDGLTPNFTASVGAPLEQDNQITVTLEGNAPNYNLLFRISANMTCDLAPITTGIGNINAALAQINVTLAPSFAANLTATLNAIADIDINATLNAIANLQLIVQQGQGTASLEFENLPVVICGETKNLPVLKSSNGSTSQLFAALFSLIKDLKKPACEPLELYALGNFTEPTTVNLQANTRYVVIQVTKIPAGISARLPQVQGQPNNYPFGFFAFESDRGIQPEQAIEWVLSEFYPDIETKPTKAHIASSLGVEYTVRGYKLAS